MVTNIFNWLGTSDHSVEITDKITEIKINTSSVSTTMIPTDTNILTAEYEGKGKVSIDKSGNRIEVEAKGPRFHLFSFNTKNELLLYIPKDYHQDLDIEVGSGSLKLAGTAGEDPLAFADFNARIGSGTMKLQNIKSENAELQVSSGSIEVESFTSKTGSFNISSGELNLKQYTGEIDAQVSSGLLNLQVNELTGPATIHVSSGKADLDLPEEDDFQIIGQTSSGSISNNLNLPDQDPNENKIHLKQGSGKHDVHLKVSSGHIHLH